MLIIFVFALLLLSHRLLVLASSKQSLNTIPLLCCCISHAIMSLSLLHLPHRRRHTIAFAAPLQSPHCCSHTAVASSLTVWYDFKE